MKGFSKVLVLILCTSGMALADGKARVEESPYKSTGNHATFTDAPWDLHFSFEIYSIDLGVAGAEYDGTYFYAAKWASNLLNRFDLSGNLVEQFTIPGVSGLRDLAYDGAFMYGGTAGFTIYQMDFTTKTLIAAIPSPVPVRQVAYDEAHDAFWVGNWNTDIMLVNRAGSSLLTIPQPVHGLNSMYGSAYDRWTPGGPYLWVFDQGQGAEFPQLIHQIDLNSLTPTGMAHDVTADFPVSPALAGGLWTAADFVPGTASIGGILQSTPDIFFVYELARFGDPADPNPPANVTAYSDFTTPASMLLTWTDPATLVNGDPITPFMIEIKRDGTPIASVAGGAGTYTDTGLNDGQLYHYEVYTRLIANDSISAIVEVSWHAGGHPVPASPNNLQAAGSLYQAVLTWEDPTTQADGTPLDDLDHINIYRNGVLVGSAAPGTETYADVPPAAGFYDYTVTAVDNEIPPNESDPGNEAGAFVGATPDFLVWVHPDIPAGTASAASGDSLFEALLANGRSAYLTNDLFEFGADLSIYQGVFVVLGIFPNNGILQAATPEAWALHVFVTGGGNLYLEGGDCFYYDPQFGGNNINPWFDCVPLADGSDDVFNLQGLNELSAFGFAYGGENNWMDELSSGGESSEIWQETATLDIHGLYYDGFGGAAIGVVPSFGGMASSASPVSTRKRTYERPANRHGGAGSYHERGATLKARPERATEKRFRKRGGYKPELAARIDRSRPLYKITPHGIEFLANTQVDLMAAYLDLMNPLPEIIYYKFNEVGQTTTQNFAASGTPAPATAAVNGLTMGGAGQEGAALIGNGGASGTNYVDTGWPTNLNGSWSISFWVNDMLSATTLYYFWGDNTAASFRCFTGGVAGANNLIVRATGMTDVLITGVAPGPSEVVIIYDPAVQQLRGYLNGVLQTTVAQTTPLVLTGTAPFKVGGYSTLTGLPLNTLLDEFKIYSRAIDVEPNSRDYAVPQFVDLPAFWYVGFSYDIKGLVVNKGSDPQGGVPVRFFVDGVQVGSDVLVSLASGDSAIVSYTWSPPAMGVYALKIQSFLPGDQQPSNDSVSTYVYVSNGGGPNPPPYPDHFEVTLTPPQTLTDTLTIFNTYGVNPLDFFITIEGVQGANNRVDVLATEQARRAPVIARGREIPLAEYLERVGVAPKSVPLAGGSQKPEHPEDLMEPYDRIMPGRTPGGQILQGQDHKGLKKISTIGFNSSPDGEEIFGSAQNVFGPAGARGRGNHFFCSSATTLTEHRFYLNMTANSDMQFLVYEGDAQAGNYNLINISEVASSGTGQGWYSSGPINVPLVVGKYYLIYPQWSAPANYYNQQNIVPYPIPASFGELQMGVGWNWAPAYAVPPPAVQNVPATAFGSPVAYYQTIVTGAGTSWLSVEPASGTIPAGQSMDVQVTFDAAGLTAGDYYANIIVECNDPFDPTDTVSVHLLVLPTPKLPVRPDPLVFPQPVFVNQVDSASLWFINDGNDPIDIFDISSSLPEFSVNQTAFTIPPFDSADVIVYFAPTAVGTFSGTLTIASTYPPREVGVSGEGVLPPIITLLPDTIHIQLGHGDSTEVEIDIGNVGGSDLHWSAALNLGTLPLAYELAGGSPLWMHFVGPNSGVVPPGGAGELAIRLHALIADTLYQGAIIFTSNDPATPVISIPVTLETGPTGIEDRQLLPTAFDLSNNYPNPFNPATTINYQLPQAAEVTLVIYNVLGQKVRTLINARMQPGRYAVAWDGCNDAGEAAGSGIYLCRFRAGNFTKVRKMILMK